MPTCRDCQCSSAASCAITAISCAVASCRRASGWPGQRKRRAARGSRLRPGIPRTACGCRICSDTRELEGGATLRLESWPRLGDYFETGAYVCFSSRTPVEAQLAWLRQEQPRHLIARAAVHEHLALAAYEHGAPAFDALLAIADQVTPDMRRRVEQSLGAPLHQNYGLNEFGMVAVRCPEAGRYHVHGEHCVFEIVDADGSPCVPGGQGRLLLTCLTNPAMPLLRYDTGDLARVAEGPCPCGRTLPAFADLIGRHLHIACLPAGVQAQERDLRELLETLPAAAWRGITQYQIRHARAGHFTLVLGSHAPPSDIFMRTVRDAWAACADHLPLHIEAQPHIPCASNGKYQVFVSEYFDEPAQR